MHAYDYIHINYILKSWSTCRPLQTPRADSVVLSTVRLLRGLILAPDESSRSWTFFCIPFTSNPFRGTTLSLLFTVPDADTDGAWAMSPGVPQSLGMGYIL